MNKKRLLTLFALHFSLLISFAQQTIDLAGSWDFAIGDSTRYDDYVMLPGSMQTNSKFRF
mgnify:CR=1 FL=1